jgi:hypothetical protein
MRFLWSCEIHFFLGKSSAMNTYQVFISYSSKDSVMARKLHMALQIAGAKPFLAEVNIQPGTKWKPEILGALRSAPWVFFLATPNSCSSQAVAHEIGASLALNKKFIPLMWGVKPESLPSWVDDTQAVDLLDGEKVVALLEQIGEKIKSDNFVKGVVVAGLVCFALWVLTSDE